MSLFRTICAVSAGAAFIAAAAFSSPSLHPTFDATPQNLPSSQSSSAQSQSQPAQSPPSFRFSVGDSSENIPVEVVADGLVLVQATIDGHAGWFIVDNGTQGFVIDRAFAQHNSLQASGNAVTRGVGSDSTQATIIHDVEIGLPGFTLTHRNLLVLDLKDIEPGIGHLVDGILGSRLFDDFVVSVDYEQQRLSVYLPSKFRPSANETILPVRIDAHGFPYVDATFTLPGVPPVSGSFLIDGGANYYANLYKPFCDSHHLPPAGMKLLSDPGPNAPKDGRIERIDLGAFSLRDPVITFAQDVEGLMAAKDYAGLIGAEFLERFTVVFDSPGKRILLTPNHSYDAPAEYDQSGIHLRADPPTFHRFVVTRIDANSPAADAGIQKGDRITAIDDHPALRLTLTEARRLLRQPKTRLTLTVFRESEKRYMSVGIDLRPRL